MHRDLKNLTLLNPRSPHQPALGQILLGAGKLQPDDIDHILTFQHHHSLRFGQAAQSLGFVSEDDVRHALAKQFHFPYLDREDCSYDPDLLAAYEPFGPQAASLRTIRDQLVSCHFRHGRKSLAVIGLANLPATSLFNANLAISFAQLGLDTLLVDTNLSGSPQSNIFRLRQRFGLSDILAERAWLECVTRLDHLNKLSVLPGGSPPPNPVELFNRPVMTELKVALMDQFDVILYDVHVSEDSKRQWPIAWSFSNENEAAMLVVEKNATSVASVNIIATQLERLGVPILGSSFVS